MNYSLQSLKQETKQTEFFSLVTPLKLECRLCRSPMKWRVFNTNELVYIANHDLTEADQQLMMQSTDN